MAHYAVRILCMIYGLFLCILLYYIFHSFSYLYNALKGCSAVNPIYTTANVTIFRANISIYIYRQHAHIHLCEPVQYVNFAWTEYHEFEVILCWQNAWRQQNNFGDIYIKMFSFYMCLIEQWSRFGRSSCLRLRNVTF